MWFRIIGMLELLYTPFLLVLITNSMNNSSGNHRSMPGNINPGANSVIECPLTSERSVSVLFYKHPNSTLRGCYEEKTRGPCHENMKLYRINRTRNGECDCDIEMASKRILLSDSETKRCYPIFQQGYCKIGEQLVITPEKPSEPACQKTVCYETLKIPANRGQDWVPYNNNTACGLVGSECQPGHIIAFQPLNLHSHKVHPICRPRRIIEPKGISVPPVRCTPGTYRAMSGHCQPSIPFEWD